MNDMSHEFNKSTSEISERPEYVTPVVRIMSEAEVLSAFQVTAAGTVNWWAM